MKPDTPIPPPPPGLDLGNLAGLKLGDPVVSVCPTDTGIEVGARVYLVHKIEDWRVIVRRADRETSAGGWQTKNHGGTRGMYGPVFYYSANPTHIAQAKANEAALAAQVAKQKAAREALLDLARPIGRELGDGQQFDNYGTPYQSEGIAETLADKLTPEQLTTLAGWLSVSSIYSPP